jgi:alanine dehydrogenase
VTTIRILSGTQVRQSLSMRGAIDAMRSAFGQLSAGEAVVPLRAAVESESGITLVMPALLRRSGDLAIKIVSVYPDNAKRNLPLIQGVVTAMDAETGAPTGLIDGAALTALRTGAASGLATELLALQGIHSVALFGAGIQARTQLEAVCTARAIESVAVFDKFPEAAERLAREMAGTGPMPDDIRVATSPTDALAEATIVACATTSVDPVFDGNDLVPGMHVNGVGSWQPTTREFDETTIRRGKLFVDQREAAWEEAGELIMARDAGIITESHVHAELGELVNNTRTGRESKEEITLFKSVGVGAQDAAVATAILQAAEEKGVGTVVEL